MMAPKKKILVVSPTYPYPLISGGKIRIYNLLRELSSGFAVTLLTLGEDKPARVDDLGPLAFLDQVVVIPVKQSRPSQLLRLVGGVHRWLLGAPAEVLVKYSAQQRKAFLDLVSTQKFEAIQIEYAQLGDFLLLDGLPDIPALLVAHDVAHISLRRRSVVNAGLARLFWRHEARLMKRWEERTWRCASRVIAMSENDRAQITAAVPGVVVDVIPNGVDLDKNQITTESPQPTVVFTGWSRHAPNVDGLRWFLDAVWPQVRRACPDIKLTVIGKGFAPGFHRPKGSENDGVDYLGLVHDVAPHVGGAWVSIVPLRVGSGTRLKILESMALGTPVVSTTVGCEGIDVRANEDILVADTAAIFAESLIALLKDKSLREHLALNARKLVEQTYSWQIIGDSARCVLRDAMGLGQA